MLSKRNFICLLLVFVLLLISGCTGSVSNDIGSAPEDIIEEENFNEYNIEYYTDKVSAEKVWIPIPKKWDNYGTNEIDILNIEPEPTKIYTDEHGNNIAYWKNEDNKEIEYRVEFDITVSNINHNISQSDYNIKYDKNSDIYNKYTSAKEKTQSDAPEIINLANEIVESTEDPVEKNEKILEWVSSNIKASGDVPYDLPDALSVYETRKGDCGAFANMFVALNRAAGIPARNVSVIHHPDYNEFKSGSHGDTFWGHIVSEIYLQDYGWVQIEPQSKPNHEEWLGIINENMIILTKGNEFELKDANFETKDIWFHLPIKSYEDYSEFGQFNTNIKVKKLN